MEEEEEDEEVEVELGADEEADETAPVFLARSRSEYS